MVIVFGRCVFLKERFEDTNGLLEDLNRRKTDDTVAKRKRTGTNSDLQNITQKT
jgi:hypothetical protein